MFKPFFGKCEYPGCTRTNAPIVVKANWCDQCNYKHKQAKKKGELKPVKKHWSMKKPTGEKEIFEEIWVESNGRCFVCNKPIIYPIASNFAHILSKALNKYPLFKLNKDNIRLMCHDSESSCHHRFDKTPRSALIEPMWEKVFELEQKLKDEYLIIKSMFVKTKRK